MGSKRLLNRIAVVTGSSSGLGRAIALRFANEGAKIVCSDLRSSSRLKMPGEADTDTHDLIKEAGGQSLFVKADAGDAGDMRSLVEKAAKAWGRLDVMVNNAGISIESRRGFRPIHETSEEDYDLTMRVNARSVFLGCKYAAGQMLRQDALPSGDRGWIINLSSIFGIVAAAGIPSYASAKGAVSNLTKSVALDYGKDRIRCNAISPGFTRTPIFSDTIANSMPQDVLNSMHPLGGCGLADDIAKVAVTLASEDANWLTGAVIPVDGGYTAQ